MSLSRKIFICTFCLIFLIISQGICQKKKKRKKDKKRAKEEYFDSASFEEIFQFKNINKIPFYYDEKDLKSIQLKENTKKLQIFF